MRERSETIYAENEHDYKQMMTSNDSRRQRNRKNKRKNCIDDELYAEELNCFSNYNLTIKQPSFEEKEKEDERNLLIAIENLNKRKLKKDLEEDYEMTGNFDCENSEKIFDSDLQTLISNEVSNSEGDQFLKDSMNFKLSINTKNSTEANTLSSNNSHMEAIIRENVINFDHIIKLMVIGDKSVGKTYFIDRFISDENFNKNERRIYTPTESLEIKKAFLKIQNIKIKTEFWDTNNSILNSPIIKTYLRISNGFILIADYDRVDTFSFLEKYFENILNLRNNQILFLVNKKGNLIHEVKNPLVDTKIKLIKERFGVSPVFINLIEFSRSHQSIQKFLSNVLINKLGENSIFNKLKLPDNPISKISSVKSKSPQNIKKHPNSDRNSPNRFEISKSFNLTQKRTRSMKKNLGQILEKLNLESI